MALRFLVRAAYFSMALWFTGHRDTLECDFIVKWSAASRWPKSSAYSITRTLSRADLCARNRRARMSEEEWHRFDLTRVQSNCIVTALLLLAAVVVGAVASVVQKVLEAAAGLKKLSERPRNRPFGHR